MPHSCIANWRRRCSMARRRASMREGPLAELFRATEAAQRQAEGRPEEPEQAHAPADAEPDERTVDHVPSWEEATRVEPPPAPEPVAGPPAPAPRVDPRPEPAPDPPVHIPRAAPPPPPVTRYLEPLPEQPARLHR